MIDFIYQAGSMGYYGEGYFWHRYVKLPEYPIITKTVTLNPIKGNPFKFVFDPFISKSVWNKVGLHNYGFKKTIDFLEKNEHSNLIISVAGTDEELEEMISKLQKYDIKGIEINLSCPNYKINTQSIPYSDIPLYLKLSCDMNPFDYNLENVKYINLNSIKLKFGGALSGRLIQPYNWGFIKEYKNKLKEKNIKIIGTSWINFSDICYLYDLGVNIFGICSVILVNPGILFKLKDVSYFIGEFI